MKKFVLIDGNAILHRAFHALPPLTSKKGEIVNAVYGFFSMLLKIIGDLKPEYLAVCFDRKAPTFRQTLYVGYQAQRPKMDEELTPQVTRLHEVLEKAKIAIFEVDGYEADDLIGTLSVQAVEGKWEMGSGKLDKEVRSEKKSHVPFQAPASHVSRPTSDIEVIIVSGDRDMLQLVNSHVLVLAPITGITKMILFDEEKVLEKYGLKPSQIIDYKALVGDPSDNYPGVSGVGPKTAMELLSKYETLENLYEHLGSIENKNLAEKLATDAESAGLAKKLATIVIDAPITLDLEKCAVSNINQKGLKKEFEELGFKSLIARLTNSTSEKSATTENTEGEKRIPKEEQLGFL